MSNINYDQLPLTQVKLFSPSSWSGLPLETNQIKVASAGIGEADAAAALKFLSPELLYALKKASLDPDCIYSHKIAMGGSRRYGPNRWGDGFREEILARDVGTFETAKAYRNHKSKRTDPFYGRVKLANFREGDGVVELVTEYFATPKVAAKHGGSVADEEIESLFKLGHIPVSMGSLVPGDQCVICDHFAKKPKDRCSSKREGGDCSLFGCKTGMLKIADDGRLQYVDNPKNRFYDISMVKIGADPIAYGSLLPIGDRYDELQSQYAKTAELFEDMFDGDQPLQDYADSVYNHIVSLAAYEAKSASIDTDLAIAAHVAEDIPAQLYNKLASSSVGVIKDAIKQLAGTTCVIDYRKFAAAHGQSEQDIDHQLTFMPDLFTRIRLSGGSSKVASLVKKFENLSVDYHIKVASLSPSRVNWTSMKQSAMRLLANDQRVEMIVAQPMNAVIPDLVCKYAAVRLLADQACNYDAAIRYISNKRSSTRMR